MMVDMPLNKETIPFFVKLLKTIAVEKAFYLFELCYCFKTNLEHISRNMRQSHQWLVQET